ncbi:hypothetical protein C1H46_001983 [Malus baccata]|uniref:Uncharacterized protein n=1 Tax=Malus baccata TaxID=106549 RepID=A0A540NP81_MALBA|nr:hypothetical protein C1H46_001983 [Malus baccata]
MDDASEEVAVEIAAQGVLRKRVNEMEAGFMMALDYMMQLVDSDQDDKLNLGKTVQAMIKNVMARKNESADHSSSDDEDATRLRAAIVYLLESFPLPRCTEMAITEFLLFVLHHRFQESV